MKKIYPFVAHGPTYNLL